MKSRSDRRSAYRLEAIGGSAASSWPAVSAANYRLEAGMSRLFPGVKETLMNRSFRLIGLALISSFAAVHSATSLAQTSTNTPAAVRYYPFVGKWRGEGELSQPGQSPEKLVISLACRKVSSGWGVGCRMRASNSKLRMTETDLMGVDPVTGQGHWYAVTNQGDTHDHLTQWKNAHTMLAHYQWVEKGSKYIEKIEFHFKGKALTFRSVVNANGKEVESFGGSLQRADTGHKRQP